MNTIQLVIVDDEPFAHRVIEGYCNKIDYVGVASNCYDGVSAINYLNKNATDALILDIQMPDLTGLELLDTLREKAPKTIFTTAHTDFALQGFEYDQVVDYLHKPVRLTRFIKAMERLKGQLELEKLSKKPLSATDGLVSSQNGQYVLVKQNKTTFKVALDDIQYMQSWGNYLKIFTRDGKMKIARKTISEMEKELLYHGFYRIHNSYLVNSKAVNGIVGNHVMLSKQRLPIGRAYKINTMKQLFE